MREEVPIVNYQTNEQLSEMKLHAMKLEYQRQAELPAIRDLDFDERFSMIVNEQYSARKDSKIKRLVKAANLRDPSAYLANIDYEPVRKIKKADVARLSNCEWIRNGSNLIVTESARSPLESWEFNISSPLESWEIALVSPLES